MMADLLQHPAFWVVVYAASELVGMSKLKSNSLIELAFSALKALKPANIKKP